jgi:hypothetical protein
LAAAFSGSSATFDLKDSMVELLEKLKARWRMAERAFVS